MIPKEKQKYHQMAVGGELKLSPDFSKNGGILWQYQEGLVDLRISLPLDPSHLRLTPTAKLANKQLQNT